VIVLSIRQNASRVSIPMKPKVQRETNSKIEEMYMRINYYVLLLGSLALIGCVAEPTTVTTTTTREVTTTGPGGRAVVVTQAPPAVRVETQPVSPGARYVWTPGYWRWTGASYVWVSGSWVLPPRQAAVWVPGHWTRTAGGGWMWTAGYWQ
jgi:WXXGXW repeat (2 copies)